MPHDHDHQHEAQRGHGRTHDHKHGHAHDHDQDHDDERDRDHRHARGHGHEHGHEHGHGHKHDHEHGHGHGGHHHHHGDPNSQGRAFAIAIALNTVFVAIEFGYGFIANSTALMADAGHNLSDVLGLMLAWGAAILARRAPNQRYTYGLRSSSMLAALFNAMLLMAACGGIAWEAVQQLMNPTPVQGLTVSVVAAVGIAVNGFSAWLFMAGAKDDLNIRGAYLHLAADAAISLGVLVAGLVVLWTGWSWLDPLVSIAIVFFIVVSTWSLLREALKLVLAAVPDSVNAPEVERFLRGRPGVNEVHDLHIWAMSTTETALTAHLVMPSGHPGDEALDEIAARLQADFSVHHCTLQVEMGTTDHACCLKAP